MTDRSHIAHFDPALVPGTATAVGQLFSQRIAEGKAPAGAYVVFTPHGIAFAGGTPVRPDVAPEHTAFRIASCTKSFTTAAMLVAEQAGALSVDQRISEFVKAPWIGPDGMPCKAPTLEQLATMTGGLATDDPWADRLEGLRDKEFDALVAPGIRLNTRPGTRWEYSNLGYALLGRAIARATGTPFMYYVRGELLEPLQLVGIDFDDTVDAAAVARGFHRYPASHAEPDPEWFELAFSRPGAFSPIGGLFATPVALSRWAAWLSAAAADVSDQPLTRERRDRMQQPHAYVSPGVSYGYGLIVEEHPVYGAVVSHSGGYPGFGAHLRWHVASGIGIVALENATYSGPVSTATTALNLILEHVVTEPSEPALWPETAELQHQLDQLLRRWDGAAFEELARQRFSRNVDQDEPISRRAARISELVSVAGTRGLPPAELHRCSPHSKSPSHLRWVVRGRTANLRAEFTLTPTNPPKVQTFSVTLG